MSKRKPAGMPEDTSPAAKKLHMDVMRVMEAAKAAINYSSLSGKVGAASMDDDSKAMPPPPARGKKSAPKTAYDFEIREELKELGFVHTNISSISGHLNGADSVKIAKIYRVMDKLTEESNLQTLKALRIEVGFEASQISNILSHGHNKIESLGRCVDHIKALKKAGITLVTIARELLAHRPKNKGGFEAAIETLYTKEGLPPPEFAESEDSEEYSSSSSSVARKKTKSKAKSSKTKLTKKKQKSLETDDDDTEEEDSEATEDDDYQDSSSAAALYSDHDSEADSDNATYLAQQQFDPSLLSHEMESSSSEDFQENDPVFSASATPFISLASQTPMHSSSSSSSAWMAATPLSSVVSQTPVHKSYASDDEIEDNDPDHELNYASFEPAQSTDMLGDAY